MAFLLPLYESNTLSFDLLETWLRANTTSR